jgi:hypothetical protein
MQVMAGAAVEIKILPRISPAVSLELESARQ